jgi:PAS domain S-box-containing protein
VDAFDAGPLPSYITDRETLRFLRVNRAACALYGWTPEEFAALTLHDIRPVEDRPRLAHLLAETRDRAVPFTAHSRHLTKAGKVFEVDVHISRTEYSGRMCSLIVARDVTGERELERRMRLVAERSHEGVSIIGADRRVVFMSPGGERMMGYAPGELIGQPSARDAHPDDLAALKPIPPGETGVTLTRVRHRDGSWRWIEALTTNLTVDPGVRGYVSSFRDVSARVLAEESLRRSEENFRTLVEHTPDAILVHREGKLVYMNPAASAMLGYEREDEVVGVPVLDLVHPDDQASVTARMAHTAKHGGGAPGEARMRRRDGSYVITEGEGMMLEFDGELSTVVIGRDVTERRELFARMALADRLLSVGTLAAGVAHEINNPLAYVCSNLELLARELPHILAGAPCKLGRAEVEQLVADARDGASRVAAIVRDLRALSRPEDEPGSVGAVDLAKVLASCMKMANNEIRFRARITSHIEDNLPPARGSASRLGQVFLNLLVNAAQAIPEGDVAANEIRVRAFAAAESPQVIVEVSDTGVGIPPAVIGRIFDPFFTTKPVGLGTGLGLSISHEIVRAIGGTIAADSKVGGGSTFRVALPIATATAATTHDTTARVPSEAARVLVIDDEPAVCRAIALLLAADFHVTCLTRAAEALARIRQGERYDVIVCDVLMPEMTGIEFYQQLATIAPSELQRVVFLTGGAFTAEARDFLAAPGRVRLDKPFSERDLRRAIAGVK